MIIDSWNDEQKRLAYELKLDQIHPVETHNTEIGNILFKRLDLYKPVDENHVGGGKSIQTSTLLINNLEKIRTKYNSTVSTAAALTSPQHHLVAGIAEKMGLKTFVGIQGTPERLPVILEKYSMVKAAEYYGATVLPVTKAAYQVVIESRMQKQLAEMGEYNFFIKFGINLEKDKDAIIGSIANQVKNIPDELDHLVIPSGSCLSAAGIINGLYKFKKKVKNIHVIQIAGGSHASNIEKNMPIFARYRYNFYLRGDIPYKEHRYYTIGNGDSGFRLDPVYEGKGWDYLINNHKDMGINPNKESVLFWVVGSTISTREYFGEKLNY